jgi:hypothetical protein
MYGMPRADRQTTSDDNARNNPRSQRTEPPTYEELRQKAINNRVTIDNLNEEKVQLTEQIKIISEQNFQVNNELKLSVIKIKEWESIAAQNNQLYISEQKKNQRFFLLYDEEQKRAALLEAQLSTQQKNSHENETQIVHVSQKFNSSQVEVSEWKERSMQYQQLYLGEQKKYIQTTYSYEEEQKRAVELIKKYEEADSQRIKYFTLYGETQAQLKKERKSKAGIRSWETRRKVENQRLKEEIAEMTVLLRESLLRKGEAVDNLYALADRMDQMQQLVDSVEDESEAVVHQTGLRQKIKRIWMSIQDILAE